MRAIRRQVPPQYTPSKGRHHMKTTLRRLLGLLAMTAGLCTATAQAENLAICYNCPPQWADWAGQVANIKEDTGITVPLDNKNSGQSLAQHITETATPFTDVGYWGRLQD